MRRVVTILVILAFVIAGTIFTYRITAQEKELPAPDYQVIAVQPARIVSTVSATGAIEPEAQVALVFKGAGRVSEVLVQEGDPVASGEVIARLETDDLNIALAQAEVNLAIAQAQSAKLQQGANDLDIQAAEANLASAQAALESARVALGSAQTAYNDLVAGPSQDEKEAAAANLERARIVRDQAQAAYDQIAGAPNAGMLPQALQLQQATVDYDAAAANYRLATAPPKDSQIASARAQIAQSQAGLAQAEAAVASAESTLQSLLDGPQQEDLAVAEAQVTQAELALQQAKLTLENAELRSPTDGVITELNLQVGELTSAGVPAAVVTDLSRFHIDIDVDEIDIAKLRQGQEVSVTLDALPDAQVAGHVEYISPTPRALATVVTYPVQVVIDESDTDLRTGLSATASIITAEVDDALVIPNRTIQIDRSTGRTFVDRLVDGVPERTEVTLGLRNEQESQVLSGLEAGDEIVIGSSTGADQLRNVFFGQ